MHKILGKYADVFYALLRIVSGYLFMVHGIQKIFGIMGGQQVELASLMGVAGIIELVAGALIMIGLFASWAAFVAAGQMAVAYFMVHAAQGAFYNPIANGGQGAVLFCFIFLYIAARGAGRWSVAREAREAPAARREAPAAR